MDNFSESIKRAAEDREQMLKKSRIAPTSVVRAKDGSGIDARVVTYHSPKSNIAENYRGIFTHLKNASEKLNAKVIAIVSSSLNEGKSITAVNLSVIMAADFGKKVLLLDCNLRSPRIDELLNINAQGGLSEILSDNLTSKAAVKPTGINNLFVITAGKEAGSPVELLHSQKLPRLLKELRAEYDYIIIDTAAVIPYSDFKVMAPWIDAAALVVRVHKTSREVITRAEAMLKELRINVLGFMLTDVEYYIPDFIYRHL
ncbi:MAG: CpsD/CapB family tyrosine-protein kinase [Candidatus Omnitrophica bacterium]|nr:CpsD/CapB family tyrosine-protein kinase [Candidatus Omnitrophota bacterium]